MTKLLIIQNKISIGFPTLSFTEENTAIISKLSPCSVVHLSRVISYLEMDQRRVPCQETKCGLQLCFLIGQMLPDLPLIGQYIELCQCANLSQKAPLQHSYISTFIFGPFLILDTGLAWIASSLISILICVSCGFHV